MNLGAQLRALKMHRVQLSGFIHHFSVGRRAVLCGFGWVTILGLPSDSDSVFYTVAQEVLSESQPLPLPCRDTWLTPEEQVIARSSSATMVSTSDAALALTLRVQITTAALSPQVTTDDLRSLFSKCGQITGITCRLGSQRFHNETALLPLGGQGFEHIATNQYSTPTRRRGRGVAELRTCEALVAFDDSIGLHTALIAFHGVQKPNPQALAGWGAQKTYNLSMHVSISAVPADGKECTRVKLQRPPQLWYDPSGEDKILQFFAPCGKIKNVFLSVFSIKVTFDTAEAALNAVRMNGETHVLGLATPSGVARESSRASFGNIAPSLGLTWLIPHSIGSPNEGPPKPRTVWISGLPRHWTRQSCIDAFAAAGTILHAEVFDAWRCPALIEFDFNVFVSAATFANTGVNPGTVSADEIAAAFGTAKSITQVLGGLGGPAGWVLVARVHYGDSELMEAAMLQSVRKTIQGSPIICEPLCCRGLTATITFDTVRACRCAIKSFDGVPLSAREDLTVEMCEEESMSLAGCNDIILNSCSSETRQSINKHFSTEFGRWWTQRGRILKLLELKTDSREALRMCLDPHGLAPHHRFKLLQRAHALISVASDTMLGPVQVLPMPVPASGWVERMMVCVEPMEASGYDLLAAIKPELSIIQRRSGAALVALRGRGIHSTVEGFAEMTDDVSINVRQICRSRRSFSECRIGHDRDNAPICSHTVRCFRSDR